MQNEQLIARYLQKLSIEKLMPMQQSVLDNYENHDAIIIYSPTGSGKTIGFLLPSILSLRKNVAGVQALVLSPSRELAQQIEQVFKSFGTDFKVNCCYGGHDMRVEQNNLSVPPAVLIGTPGRIADHIRRENFDCRNIRILILDEFDKALEFGFQNEMQFIVSSLNLEKRLLISATRIAEMPDFAMPHEPFVIDYLLDAPKLKMSMNVVRADGHDKLQALFHLLCKIGSESTLVFCNHREAVERIGDLLYDYKIPHDIYHGGMKQESRERSLIKFRNHSCNVLVTTDLASRGLDISEVRNVVHYQLPTSFEAMTHRNGRTARMNSDGAVYFVLSDEEFLPDFATDDFDYLDLPTDSELPQLPYFTTINFDLGKKDKVNKVDIVGLLCKKCGLNKNEVGVIDVLDFDSFAAVPRTKVKQILKSLRDEKIKNKKVRIRESY